MRSGSLRRAGETSRLTRVERALTPVDSVRVVPYPIWFMGGREPGWEDLVPVDPVVGWTTDTDPAWLVAVRNYSVEIFLSPFRRVEPVYGFLSRGCL